MKFKGLRLRLRCLWHTGASHELDFHSGRCRFCWRSWEQLYPTDAKTAATAPAQSPTRGWLSTHIVGTPRRRRLAAALLILLVITGSLAAPTHAISDLIQRAQVAWTAVFEVVVPDPVTTGAPVAVSTGTADVSASGAAMTNPDVIEKVSGDAEASPTTLFDVLGDVWESVVGPTPTGTPTSVATSNAASGGRNAATPTGAGGGGGSGSGSHVPSTPADQTAVQPTSADGSTGSLEESVANEDEDVIADGHAGQPASEDAATDAGIDGTPRSPGAESLQLSSSILVPDEFEKALAGDVDAALDLGLPATLEVPVSLDAGALPEPLDTLDTEPGATTSFPGSLPLLSAPFAGEPLETQSADPAVAEFLIENPSMIPLLADEERHVLQEQLGLEGSQGLKAQNLSATALPEPASLLLVATGVVVSLAAARRRRRRPQLD